MCLFNKSHSCINQYFTNLMCLHTLQIIILFFAQNQNTIIFLNVITYRYSNDLQAYTHSSLNSQDSRKIFWHNNTLKVDYGVFMKCE